MSKTERIEELQEFLKEDSSNILARRELALLLLDSGFAKEAKMHLTVLLKGINNDSELYYNLGIANEKLKNFFDAKNAYLKALELQPNDLDYIYNLGLVLTELKDYEYAFLASKKFFNF